MNHPNNEIILEALVKIESTPLPQIMEEFVMTHSVLFPEDYLFGSSSYEKYRKWVDRVLIPRLSAAGDQGRQVLKTIREIDLTKHPELVEDAVLILSNWFFPEQQDLNSILALLVITRKILQGKNDEKS